MKKSFTVAILLALGIAPVLASAYAERGLGVNANVNANISVHSTTTGTTTRDHEGDRDNDDEGHGGVMAGVKGELHGGLRSEFVRANLHAAVEVFGATINRLNKIITRVEARITKIHAAGGNTTEAQSDVTLAKSNIADAQVQVGILTSFNVSTTTSTTTLAANLQAARAAAKKGREDLTSAKQNLMKAVQALVKVEVGLKASTTAHYQDND